MKLKYYFPTSLEYIQPLIVRLIACIGLIIIVLASSAQAMKLPEAYGDNQCELIAKDYQREFGGALIWIQPIDKNGEYISGEYAAHLINRAYSKERGVYYIDYKTGVVLKSQSEVLEWYIWYSNGKNARIYDLSQERPEFGMIWHY